MTEPVPDPMGWRSWREIPSVCPKRRTLTQTALVAVVVGTVLFAINWFDVVVRGRATPEVWLKVILNYLVPFCVSNHGVLVATRRAP